MSQAVVRHLVARAGIAAGAGKPKGRKLPDLPGIGLERVTERDLQRQIVRDLRRAGLFPMAVPNQRSLRHLPDEAQHGAINALVADGMVIGALDLLVQWDAAKGAPGNRGLCWIECKRPVKPAPVSPEQDRFIETQRTLGVVAGVAQSYGQAEALLVEAGAPLRFLTTWPAPAAEKEAGREGAVTPVTGPDHAIPKEPHRNG